MLCLVLVSVELVVNNDIKLCSCLDDSNNIVLVDNNVRNDVLCKNRVLYIVVDKKKRHCVAVHDRNCRLCSSLYKPTRLDKITDRV